MLCLQILAYVLPVTPFALLSGLFLAGSDGNGAYSCPVCAQEPMDPIPAPSGETWFTFVGAGAVSSSLQIVSGRICITTVSRYEGDAVWLLLLAGNKCVRVRLRVCACACVWSCMHAHNLRTINYLSHQIKGIRLRASAGQQKGEQRRGTSFKRTQTSTGSGCSPESSWFSHITASGYFL